MKNFLTLTLSVIAFLSMSIQWAVAQDCSDGCRCTPPCRCFGIEDCGCACLNFNREAGVLIHGEQLGASRDVLEKAFGYYNELKRSSVIRRLVNEFLGGGCLEIIPKPENAHFVKGWNMYGEWTINDDVENWDDCTGDITKYDYIVIPFYDTTGTCTTFVEYRLNDNMDFRRYYLRKLGYTKLQSGRPIIYQGSRVIIDYYVRQREGKETEYVAVGDGFFKGWVVKMIRPAQVFGKSME